MVVQELHQRDWANRITFAQNTLEIVADDVAISMSDESHFHLSGCVNKQNSVIGRTQIHGSFMNALFTLNM
jgi:hypothetical protein